MSVPFATYVTQPDANIDLATAALLIAAEVYPALDVPKYLQWLDVQGERARERLEPSSRPSLIISELNHLAFDELGLHANAEEYYDPRNSYLNEVIERRTGIPITLSLVYMEIARRAAIRVEGVGLPGHFIVRVCGDNWQTLVDPFHRGVELTREDCEQLLAQVYGKSAPLLPQYLEPVSKRAFLTRMLTNLQIIHLQQQQWPEAYNAIGNLLSLQPGRPQLGDLIRARGLVNYKLHNWREAEDDWLRYLTLAPNAHDASLVRENIESLRATLARRN